MSALILNPSHWYCPNCETTATRPDVWHVCPGLKGLNVALVPAGADCKIEAREREDYIGDENTQTDGDGHPIMSVVTTRADGSNDTAVYAPVASISAEAIGA